MMLRLLARAVFQKCCRSCCRTGTANRLDLRPRQDRSQRTWLPSYTWRHCLRWARDIPPESLCLREGHRLLHQLSCRRYSWCRRCSWHRHCSWCRHSWCRRYSWFRRFVRSRWCHSRRPFHPPHLSRCCHQPQRFRPCLTFRRCPLASKYPCTEPRCQTVRSDRSRSMPMRRPRPCIGRRQGSGRYHLRNKSTCRHPGWLHIGPWPYIAHCTSLWRSPSHRLHSRSWFGSRSQGNRSWSATRISPCRPVAGSGLCPKCWRFFHLRRPCRSRREFHLPQVPSHRLKRFRRPMTGLHHPAYRREFHLPQIPSHRLKSQHQCPMMCLRRPTYRQELLRHRWNSHPWVRRC